MFDVAIIGAGLSGCSAAITLAEQGFRVMMFEAKSFPHHKVCGEFLSPASRHYLNLLGVWPAVCAPSPAPVRSVSVTTPNGTCWQAALPGTGLGISRWALDQILIQHAQTLGVQVLEKANVVGVEGRLETGFVLKVRAQQGVQTFASRVVLAAYGKSSNLDRVFARNGLTQNNGFMGLKNHFYGAALTNRIDLYTFPGGYCGLVEIEAGQINLCLLVRQDIFRQVSNGDIEQFIAWMRTQNSALDAWMHTAAPIHDPWMSISRFSFAPKSLIEHDVLMTGDAAGLIAPLAGDGMEMALCGGQTAATAITHFLNGHWSPEQLRHRYPQVWCDTFRTRLSLARLLQFVMLRPQFADVGLQVLNRIPSLGDFIIKRTRDMPATVNAGV